MTQPPTLAVPDVAPEQSPTGKPLIPTAAVPWIAGVTAVAAALAQALPDHTQADLVCQQVILWGTWLLAIGPGIRRHAPKAASLLVVVACIGLLAAPSARADACDGYLVNDCSATRTARLREVWQAVEDARVAYARAYGHYHGCAYWSTHRAVFAETATREFMLGEFRWEERMLATATDAAMAAMRHPSGCEPGRTEAEKDDAHGAYIRADAAADRECPKRCLPPPRDDLASDTLGSHQSIGHLSSLLLAAAPRWPARWPGFSIPGRPGVESGLKESVLENVARARAARQIDSPAEACLAALFAYSAVSGMLDIASELSVHGDASTRREVAPAVLGLTMAQQTLRAFIDQRCPPGSPQRIAADAGQAWLAANLPPDPDDVNREALRELERLAISWEGGVEQLDHRIAAALLAGVAAPLVTTWISGPVVYRLLITAP